MLSSLKARSAARQEQRWTTQTAVLTVIAIALACSTAAFAQNEDKVKAGLAAWRSSGCADCHGAFANGEKERDESPTGADLRRARLNTEELKLAIRCGRPGTGMPSFEEGARGCPGGGGELYPAPTKLSPAEGAWTGLFTKVPEVHVLAAHYLVIVSLAYPFLGLGLTLTSAFQAAGRPLWPLLGITSRALVVAVGGWIAVHLAGTDLIELAVVAAFGLIVYGASLTIAFRAGVWRTPRL